jgi:hypothetical protein
MFHTMGFYKRIIDKIQNFVTLIFFILNKLYILCFILFYLNMKYNIFLKKSKIIIFKVLP